LHLLPHTQFSLSTLPWKRNRLLLCRALLLNQYRTTTKSIQLEKLVSVTWTSRVSAPNVGSVIFLKIPTTHAVLFREMSSAYYWHLIKMTAASRFQNNRHFLVAKLLRHSRRCPLANTTHNFNVAPTTYSPLLTADYWSKSKFLYDLPLTTNQPVLASSPLRPTTRLFFRLNSCVNRSYVTSSLTRRQIHHLWIWLLFGQVRMAYIGCYCKFFSQHKFCRAGKPILPWNISSGT
jgi:hypothetical protein